MAFIYTLSSARIYSGRFLRNVNHHLSKHKYDACIVGAGLSGAVIANQHATKLRSKVLVIEKRHHIGGNCYDYIDKDTGIRVNEYGAHLFHTNYKEVWDYIRQFSKWIPWEHKVLAFVKGKYVPVPVNIDTINALFGTSITSEAEASVWLQNEQIAFPTPKNSEEMALSRVGPRLYNLLFKPYTIKQWDKQPANLGPSVLARIPVRSNHDPRYFSDTYQALPENGYTPIFEKMFANPLITVLTSVDYFDVKASMNCKSLYYTGPIDTYFADIGLPKLEYRSLEFERKVVRNVDKFQPNSVVNHPSSDRNYTRIVEYKHFLNQRSSHTVIFYEHSTDHGEPYYPVPNPKNQALYAKYQDMAERTPGIYFVGRLANYKYFNMDQTIKNALDVFDLTRPDRLELVINYCKEDLSWVDTWVKKLDISKVYIYSKCGQQVPVTTTSKMTVTSLPNVGREGHSWLYHILHTKKKRSGRSIFVQGKHEVFLDDVASAVSVPGQSRMFHDLTWRPFWPCGVDEMYAVQGVGQLPHGHTYESYLDVLYKNITGNSPTSKTQCSFRGEFIVTNQLIDKVKMEHKNVLNNLFRLLTKSNNPVEGHMLERLWKTLFAV